MSDRHTRFTAMAHSLLDKVYEDSEDAAFLTGSARRLRDRVNAQSAKKQYSLREIKHYLEGKQTYTLHRQSQHTFARNHFTITAPFLLFEMDLMDTKSTAADNDKTTFVLFVIDCFSKYVWFRCLRNKDAQTVSKALRQILDDDCPRYPEAINSDLGREFHNFRVKALLDSRNIKHHRPHTASAWKCAIIERFLRTAKEKIRRYLTFMKKNRYIDDLPMLIRSYNDTVHSSTKKKPSEVSYENTPEVYRNLRHSNEAIVIPKQNFQTGDRVRVAVKKTPLDAGVFKPEQWTREVFKIDEVINKRPIKLYTITDLKNKKIFGKYYEKQLQKVNVKNDTNFVKDKIMRQFLLKDNK